MTFYANMLFLSSPNTRVSQIARMSDWILRTPNTHFSATATDSTSPCQYLMSLPCLSFLTPFPLRFMLSPVILILKWILQGKISYTGLTSTLDRTPYNCLNLCAQYILFKSMTITFTNCTKITSLRLSYPLSKSSFWEGILMLI